MFRNVGGVLVEETDVHERPSPWKDAYFAPRLGEEFPANLRSFFEEKLRLQGQESFSQVALACEIYSDVDVVVPWHQPVMASRPDQRTSVQEEGDVGLGQRAAQRHHSVHQQAEIVARDRWLENLQLFVSGQELSLLILSLPGE